MADNNSQNTYEKLLKEKKQHGPFKKKRAGEVLTKNEVKEIKAGRKKLKKELKSMGIKGKSEFELAASSQGLYFDKKKNRLLPFLAFWKKGGWALLAAAALLLASLFAVSVVTELQGHFTISLSDDLFDEGFVLSETKGFENPTAHLFATPAESVPCVSIIDIPQNIDEIDGQHNGDYFASTFYIRNEGSSTVGYEWQLRLNAESKKLSTAAWVMVFEDGKMQFFAKADESGDPQCLPAKEDNTRGYLNPPLYEKTKDASQYEIIKKSEAVSYWRILPKPFKSKDIITEGKMLKVKPQEVHKYTVVIWLEGDDPDCTDELIGGHLGMDFQFQMIEK